MYDCRGTAGKTCCVSSTETEVPHSLFWFGEMDREVGADRRRVEFLETKMDRPSHIYLGQLRLAFIMGPEPWDFRLIQSGADVPVPPP